MRFLWLSFFFFLLLTFVSASPPTTRETDCTDPDEVYLYCGSRCPARCGDKPGDRVCATDCVNGCFCKKGLVLNSSNKCVKPEKC